MNDQTVDVDPEDDDHRPEPLSAEALAEVEESLARFQQIPDDSPETPRQLRLGYVRGLWVAIHEQRADNARFQRWWHEDQAALDERRRQVNELREQLTEVTAERDLAHAQLNPPLGGDGRYRTRLTVDTVVLSRAAASEPWRVLLVKRAKAPFAGEWALPGGHVDEGETLEVAARRELREETGVEVGPLRQVGAYDSLHRDPRDRSIAVAFVATLDRLVPARPSSDAEAAEWHVLDEVLDALDEDGERALAFDHGQILRDAWVQSQRR